MRGFLKISQNKLPKRTFRATLPQNFSDKASKTNVLCEASSKFHRTSFQTNVSCEASSKFQRTSFQNERFVLPQIFTEQASKTNVSRETSCKFHRTSFQNERFVRGFLEISKNKLPKRAFCARLPQIFTEQASKTNVSRETSCKFHRTSFQNERFVRRGFLEISKNKLPKRAFRARLPTNFHRTSFKNERFARDLLQISQNKLPKRAFRAKLPQIFIEQSFQNERFARSLRQFQKKICVSPEFRAIDPPNPTRGFIQQKQNVRLATTACHPHFQNVRFTTAACTKMYEFSA